MGNKSAKEEHSTIIQDQQFKINHPKLKKATFKKTNHREYLETIFPITNAKEYDTWNNNLKESPAEGSDFALKPLKHTFKKGGMCGNAGNSTVQYDLHPFPLNEEIKLRYNGTRKQFSEPELWYLLYGLCDVASNFHQKGMKAGDIRPSNVFLAEDGKVKVATQHSWPGQISAYEKRCFEHEKVYLSPEEVTDISVGRAKPSGNPELSESFSVGLTCLEAALLKNNEGLYDKDNFDYDSLEGLRENIKNEPMYSNLLKLVLLSLTERSPEDRQTCTEIAKWLKPNEQRIIGMQPFTVNQLPPRVRQIADSVPIPTRSMNLEKQNFGKSEQPSIPFTVDPIKSEKPSIPFTVDPTRTLIVEYVYNNSRPEYKTQNVSWAQIDEKIRKSKQMFPSQ